MLSVIWRTVMSSARRAQKDVPLSRAAEDVGPYQRSGLQCRSRVVGRDVLGAPRAEGKWYNGDMKLEDVRDLLETGNRVLLMTRHAERPHIDPDDPSFGESLPITEHGMRMAEAFGRQFRAFASDVQFFSSPLRRTRMTAQYIAKGMDIDHPEIPADGRLGNSSFYFADQHAVFELFRDGTFFEKVFAYIEKGRQTGFADLRAATDALEDWVLARFTRRLGIFTTHDLYNGAFLACRGVVPKFTVENWIQYLDSAAIVLAPDGTRSYRLIRSEIA